MNAECVALSQGVTDRAARGIMRDYNEARHHMSPDLKTPKQAWDELKTVNQFRDVK